MARQIEHPLALVKRTANRLRTALERHTIGSLIPGEEKLVSKLGLGRVTTRSTLQLTAKDGLISAAIQRKPRRALTGQTKGRTLQKRIELLLVTYLATLGITMAAERPNIVLIYADDLGFLKVGYQSESRFQTPVLDQLAKNGMIFTDASTNAANCQPARVCLLSGNYTPRQTREWGRENA